MGYGLGYPIAPGTAVPRCTKWQYFSTHLIMELITHGSSERFLPVIRQRQGPLRVQLDSEEKCLESSRIFQQGCNTAKLGGNAFISGSFRFESQVFETFENISFGIWVRFVSSKVEASAVIRRDNMQVR